MIKNLLLSVAVFGTLTACVGPTDADVASHNLSLEAGSFKLNRRIVFYNGITDTYILTIEGRCQIDHGEKLAVTCKTSETGYKKHYLGLSDNVTYFSEQIDDAAVNVYRYKVIFKPEAIVPDVDLKLSSQQ